MKSRSLALARVATTFAPAQASVRHSFAVRLVADRLVTVRDSSDGQ